MRQESLPLEPTTEKDPYSDLPLFGGELPANETKELSQNGAQMSIFSIIGPMSLNDMNPEKKRSKKKNSGNQPGLL